MIEVEIFVTEEVLGPEFSRVPLKVHRRGIVAKGSHHRVFNTPIIPLGFGIFQVGGLLREFFDDFGVTAHFRENSLDAGTDVEERGVQVKNREDWETFFEVRFKRINQILKTFEGLRHRGL